MIIEWTYGALAQVQRYYGVGYWQTDSTLTHIIVAVGPRWTFTKDIVRRGFNLDTERRIFIKNASYREFNLDIERRNFLMDKVRRIFIIK